MPQLCGTQMSSHVSVEIPGFVVVGVAAAKKLMQTSAATFPGNKIEGLSAKAQPLERRQNIQGIQAEREVLIRAMRRGTNAHISSAAVSIHQKINLLFRIRNTLPVLLQVPGKVKVVDHRIGIDAPICCVPGFSSGLGQNRRVRKNSFPKGNFQFSIFHFQLSIVQRSRSMAAQTASSLARICFFMGPSSTWS